MNESQESFPDPFNVETCRGHVVDIVHKQSVERVANGKKPSDISDRNQAKIVLKRIELLIKEGINVRFINDITSFESPNGFNSTNDSLILGGAFLGQCIEDYQKVLDKKGVKYTLHPLLTVKA